MVDAIKKEPFEEDEDDIAENHEEINVEPMSLSSYIKTEPQINCNSFLSSSPQACINHTVNIKKEQEEVEEEEIVSSEDESYIDSQISPREEGAIHSETPTNHRLGALEQIEQNSNLSTLAEVSLAAAGKFYEPRLNHQIDKARANLDTSKAYNNACFDSKASDGRSERFSGGIPTLDIPQSVKDAIIASANMNRAESFLPNLYQTGSTYR